MSNSDISPAAIIRGRELSTSKTCMVLTHMRVPSTNLISGRTLQPSTELFVASVSAPSGFLVVGLVSGLGTVHLLLTLDLSSTWFFPLFQRKMLSSIIGRLQKRERIGCGNVMYGAWLLCHI